MRSAKRSSASTLAAENVTSPIFRTRSPNADTTICRALTACHYAKDSREPGANHTIRFATHSISERDASRRIRNTNRTVPIISRRSRSPPTRTTRKSALIHAHVRCLSAAQVPLSKVARVSPSPKVSRAAYQQRIVHDENLRHDRTDSPLRRLIAREGFDRAEFGGTLRERAMLVGRLAIDPQREEICACGGDDRRRGICTRAFS